MAFSLKVDVDFASIEEAVEFLSKNKSKSSSLGNKFCENIQELTNNSNEIVPVIATLKKLPKEQLEMFVSIGLIAIGKPKKTWADLVDDDEMGIDTNTDIYDLYTRNLTNKIKSKPISIQNTDIKNLNNHNNQCKKESSDDSMKDILKTLCVVPNNKEFEKKFKEYDISPFYLYTQISGPNKDRFRTIRCDYVGQCFKGSHCTFSHHNDFRPWLDENFDEIFKYLKSKYGDLKHEGSTSS